VTYQDEHDTNAELHEKFLASDDPEDQGIGRMLMELKHQETMNEAALASPIPEHNHKTRAMVDAMRASLDTPTETNEIKRLEQQAEILDIAFRRLMIDADSTYENLDRCDCDPMKYAAAFKAQDQYRRTIKTLKLLKKHRKIKKTRGRRN